MIFKNAIPGVQKFRKNKNVYNHQKPEHFCFSVEIASNISQDK